MAVGSAFIQLTPSIRGFHKDTRKLLAAEDVEAVVDLKPKIDTREVRDETEKATSKAGASIELTPKLNTRDVQSEADKATRGVNPGIELTPEIDARKVDEQARKATRGKHPIEMIPNLDTGKARRESDELARKLGRTVRIPIEIDDMGGEKAVLAMQKRLMSRRISIPVHVNTARAIAELTMLNAYIGRTTRSLARLTIGGTLAFGALTLLSGAASGIGGLAASLAAASGALLVLPGAAAAGAAAIGTLVLGFQGVGDTMSAIASGDAEKFRQALGNLAPPARGLFVAIWELRGQFSELRKSVQGALFAGLAEPFREMATAVLPALSVGLTAIAGGFNSASAAAMRFFAQANTVADLGSLFGSTATLVRNLGTAFVPVLAILRDVGTVGAQVLAQMSFGALGVTQRWAAFIATARETGQLQQWIRNGITALGDLFATLGNVVGIIFTVFSAASVAGSSFLGVARQITGELLAMLRSAEGQAALTTFFTTLRNTVTAALPGLRALAGGLIDIVRSVGPALPAVGAAFSALGVALAPILTGFGHLVGFLLPPLANMLGFLAPVIGMLAAGLLPAGAAIFVLVKAWKLWNAALAVWQIIMGMGVMGTVGLVIAAIVALVAMVVYAWYNFDWFRNAVMFVFDAIVGYYQWLWSIAVMVWNGIVAAAQWVVGVYQAYVAPVIAAALSFVGTAFTWLGNAAAAVWQWIVSAALWAWNSILLPTFNAIVTVLSFVGAALFTIFVAPFLIAWNVISAAAIWAWNSILRPTFHAIAAVLLWLNNNVVQPVFSWIVSGWNWLVSTVAALWNSVLRVAWNAVAAAANWLYANVLRPIFGLIVLAWQGLVIGIQWAYNSILKPCWDALVAFLRWIWLTVISPTFNLIGQFWALLLRGMQNIYNTVLVPTWNALVAFARFLWNNVLRPTFDLIGAGWRALGDGIRWVYDNVILRTFNALQTAVDAVGRAFDAAVRWIGDVWNRIKSILAKPVNFMINVVYNDGIKRAWDSIAGWLKIPGLPRMNGIPENKRGGVIGGYTPGRDTGLSWVSGGEAIMRPEWTRAVGPGWVDQANRAARTRGTRGVQEMMATGVNDGPIRGRRKLPDMRDGLPAFAGGGHTWPRLWDIVRKRFPDISLTSNYRPGDPGYHGRGQAIDVGYGNYSRHGPVAAFIGETFPNSTELISAQWRNGVGIKNGKPLHYGAQTTSEHVNHVHWAMAGEPVPGAGGGGGIFDIVGMVVDWFVNTLMKPVADMGKQVLGDFGDGGTSLAVSKVPGVAIDAGVEWIKGLGDRLWDIASNALGALFGGGGGGAGVEQWRGVALQALKMTGQPLGMVDVLLRRMNQESGGNPNAINLWDSNAAKGTPSIGLMQTIQPTFDSHKFPGFNNIRAPLDNILASIRYTISRYGSLPAGYNRAGGYDSGGWLPPGLSATYNGTGRPEAILTAQQWDDMAALAERGAGTAGTTITVNAPTNASPERIAASVDRHLTMFGRV